MSSKKTKNKKQIRPAKADLGRSSWFQILGGIPPFAHFIFIFILIIILFLLFVFTNRNGTDSFYRAALKELGEEKTKELHYNVYGDHFVNDLAIDTNLTNFYYDNITTAFIFSPQYNWLEKGFCQNSYCGLEALDWNFPKIGGDENSKYCIGEKCLEIVDKSIFLNGNEINVPSNIRDFEIKNINIYPLSSSWLVGFVFQDGALEKGRAYIFNGNSFSDLDPQDEFPFVSRENFNRASFGFGGDDDNYLVIYGGYDFLGYQVTNKKKVDISRFFGLRVSGGGFTPIAIKQENGNETVWYVCSLTENSPRLIKLWQNETDSIKGSLSLTAKILEDREKADSAWCRSGANLGELEVIISRGNNYYRRLLQDNGFEQKNNYRLVTRNLFSKNGELEKVIFSNLLACDDKICGDEVAKNSLLFSVSGNGQDFFQAQLSKEIKLPDNSPGLYWKIETKGKADNNNYSPWIDGLTAISYSWWE
jgi:hypothetical protein